MKENGACRSTSRISRKRRSCERSCSRHVAKIKMAWYPLHKRLQTWLGARPSLTHLHTQQSGLDVANVNTIEVSWIQLDWGDLKEASTFDCFHKPEVWAVFGAGSIAYVRADEGTGHQQGRPGLHLNSDRISICLVCIGKAKYSVQTFAWSSWSIELPTALSETLRN